MLPLVAAFEVGHVRRGWGYFRVVGLPCDLNASLRYKWCLHQLHQQPVSMQQVSLIFNTNTYLHLLIFVFPINGMHSGAAQREAGRTKTLMSLVLPVWEMQPPQDMTVRLAVLV